jgi:hypothetical protein
MLGYMLNKIYSDSVGDSFSLVKINTDIAKVSDIDSYAKAFLHSTGQGGAIIPLVKNIDLNHIDVQIMIALEKNKKSHKGLESL